MANTLFTLQDTAKRGMSHPIKGRVPTREEIDEAIRLGHIPRAVREEEAGLSPGLEINKYLSMADVIPFGTIAKLAATGGVALGSLAAMNRMAGGAENLSPVAKMLPSQQGAIVYHGSPAQFDKFRVVSDSTNDMGMLGNVATQRHGASLTDNPKFAAEYGNVAKWDIKPKKTAEITDDLRDEFLNSLDPFGKDRSVYMTAKFSSKQPWLLFEGDVGGKFTSWLKAKGYDSAKFSEYIPTKAGGEVGGKTTIMLDSNLVTKSTSLPKILERNGLTELQATTKARGN